MDGWVNGYLDKEYASGAYSTRVCNSYTTEPRAKVVALNRPLHYPGGQGTFTDDGAQSLAELVAVLFP